MNLDSLIGRLAEDLRPVRPRRCRVDGAAVALLAAVELALMLAAGSVHGDTHRMLMRRAVGWRIASLGVISLASGSVALRSFDPTYCATAWPRRLALIAAICMAYGIVRGGMPAGAAGIVRRLDWTSGVQCASKIVLLSIPPLVCLAALARRGAPTDMRRTPLLIGLAAAAAGAFVFAFSCPFDDRLYIVAWYGVGCGVVTLASRFLLPRFVRW